MAKQLHKSFRDKQVKALLQSYINKEVKLRYVLDILKIGRSRFFCLLKEYRSNPSQFSIAYKRKIVTRKISPEIEKNILRQLRWEKRLIDNPDIPIRSYNYSYIRDLLWQKYQQKVSVPTIIKRAKEYDFFLRRPKRKAHDREVLTNYIGELIQHDSSHHRWSPYASEKWYLITSLDDYSRKLLYAELVERETSWDHIFALESVVLCYGAPYAYYTDSLTPFSASFKAGALSGANTTFKPMTSIPSGNRFFWNAISNPAMRSHLRPKVRSNDLMAGSKTD